MLESAQKDNPNRGCHELIQDPPLLLEEWGFVFGEIGWFPTNAVKLFQPYRNPVSPLFCVKDEVFRRSYKNVGVDR